MRAENIDPALWKLCVWMHDAFCETKKGLIKN